MAILYGVAASPYVRKVMLAHAHKNIDYSLEISFPGSDDIEFRKASPLGKIPAYKTENGVTFCDSSVIIAYLERINKENSLYPQNDEQYAKSLYLEELSDTTLAKAVSALYYQKVIGPKFFGKASDKEIIKDARENTIPLAFSLIEDSLTKENWLVNSYFSVADIALGSHLISLFHADFKFEQTKFTKLNRYISKFMNLDIVKKQIQNEQKIFNQ